MLISIFTFALPNSDGTYFRLDNLSKFVILFISFHSFLITLYSFNRADYKISHYLYLLACQLCGIIGVATNNLLIFITFMTFLTILLSLLINLRKDSDSSYTAKKILLILGITDAFFVLGLGCIWIIAREFRIDLINLPMTSYSNPLVGLSFFCLLSVCLAKVGILPFQSWIPSMSRVTSTPLMAFLPASIDKLVGIYFFTRVVNEMYIISPPIRTFLMSLGALTILYGVIMAMFQYNASELLSFHTISQAGYMIVGISSGTPIGIAGGLFHMLNNTLYKTNLFLSMGTISKYDPLDNLDLRKSGGLAKKIPVLFIITLISSLSISGIQPFNGFVSKEMIFTGVEGNFFRLFLILGSAFTLASFIKLTYSLFIRLPQNNYETPEKNDFKITWNVLIPQLLLAIMCIIFGIWSHLIPLKMFIIPSINNFPLVLLKVPSFFKFNLVKTIELIIGISIGVFLCLSLNKKGYAIKKDYLDIYEYGKLFILTVARNFARLQSGSLPFYLHLVFLTLLILLLVLK